MKFSFKLIDLPSRVRIIDTLLVPTIDELNQGLRPFGLRVPGASLALDLSQLAAGAELKDEVELEAEIRFLVNRNPPLWFRLLGPFGRSYVNRLVESRVQSLKVMRVLSSLSLPGCSTLERAISAVVLYFLVDVSFRKYGAPVSELGAIMREVTFIVRSMDEFEQELLGSLPSDGEMSRLPEMLQAQFDKARIDSDLYFAGEEARAIYGIGKGVLELKKQKAYSQARQIEGGYMDLGRCIDLLSHPGRYLIISTSRKLENFSAFDFVRRNKFILDDNGNDFVYRPMNSLGEVARLRPLDYGFMASLPEYFYQRLVGLDFSIREPVFKEEVRQVAYLLIDKSPSNLVKGRLFKNLGILFNRMLGVVRSDAVVVLQFFDGELGEVEVISDFNEALQVLKKVARMEYFVGSGTDQDKALRFGVSRLTKLPDSVREMKPHLILVGDGEGSVTISAEEMKNICFHAFITEKENSELKNLCWATDGLYFIGL
ncbi:MAG TPA: hypothetical protein PKA63_12485 [Oligoflexia bacterium]|nr:hypothetical protein [Oligoflexia bacterium]HMP49474.1 hypothetical protein [Oligoflexia bacterium]